MRVFIELDVFGVKEPHLINIIDVQVVKSANYKEEGGYRVYMRVDESIKQHLGIKMLKLEFDGYFEHNRVVDSMLHKGYFDFTNQDWYNVQIIKW